MDYQEKLTSHVNAESIRTITMVRKEDQFKRVAELRRQGNGTRTIGKELGISPTTVRRYIKAARRLGFDVRPRNDCVLGPDGKSYPVPDVKVESSSRGEYGEPIDFRGLRHAPINEQGVVFLFGMVAHELGFLIEAVRLKFPDCMGKREVKRSGKKTGRWKSVRIEFEFESRNFKKPHDPNECDVIVCWRDNWPACPSQLEVIELEKEIKKLPASISSVK